MATTPKGIYFPEGSTTANFPEIFANIAESVDRTLGDFTYDSGWIDVLNSDMSNGWTRYNSTSFKVAYRRRGKVVFHAGLIRYGTGGSMYQVPVGFRPTKGIEIFNCLTSSSVGSNNGYVGARINVSTVGWVYLSNTFTPGNDWISLNGIKYITDEPAI